MNKETRQSFIHEQARKLKEKTGLDLNTPEMFNSVKCILDEYDDCLDKVETMKPTGFYCNSSYDKCGFKDKDYVACALRQCKSLNPIV